MFLSNQLEASESTISLEALYNTHYKQLLSHLLRLVNDMETAEDLCQETFIKAIRNWEQRNPSASATAWLYRIATNTAYDELRRRRRIYFGPLYEGEVAPSSTHSMESLVDESEPVWIALAQLPSHYRVPLVLHSCEGCSTEEIAKTL